MPCVESQSNASSVECSFVTIKQRCNSSKLVAKPNLLNRVLEAQKNDEKFFSTVSHIGEGKQTEFSVKEDRSLYYKDRVCVPSDSELKKVILE